MSVHQRILLCLLITATVSGRLVLSSVDYRVLVGTGIYFDDAFYYLKIAGNIAAGRGMTFDGETPTNGFQPLYMALLVPIMRFTQPNLIQPIHASCVLLSLFSLATAFVSFGLARMLAGTRAALVVLSLWAVSPYFLLFGVNGLETGLAMFFAVTVLLLYLKLESSPHAMGKACVFFGVICGLAILARLDLLLLLLAVGCDWAFLYLRRRPSAVRPKHALLTTVVAFCTWLPWGITSRAVTGRWLPLSGQASRQIALNYGWANLSRVWAQAGPAATPPEPGSRSFDPDAVPVEFYLDVATKAVFVFLLECPLLAILRINVPFSIWPNLNAYAPYAYFCRSPAIGTALLSALLVAMALIIRVIGRRWTRGDNHQLRAIGRVLAVYLLILLPAYVFFCPAHWFFTRYVAVAVLLTTVYAVCAIGVALGRIAEARRWVGLMGGVLVVVLLASQATNWRTLWYTNWTGTELRGRLGSWEVLGPKIDKSLKIGAFQAGIISYFSELDIVNLDGKVNPDAYRALRQKRLHRYVIEKDIRYIIDWEWVVYRLCFRHAEPGTFKLRRIAKDSRPGGFSLYAVGP